MIDGQTEYVAIFGNPVAHSLSPQMHNAAFSHLGLNLAYLAFRVDEAGEAVSAMRNLGFRGASITVPHKEKIIAHLDEVDEIGRTIGAVNTIVSRAGRLCGTNTDWLGVVQPLSQMTELRGKRGLIVGAGGAARSAIYGLQRNDTQVFIMNRNEARGQKLAAEMNCTFVPWQAWDHLRTDLVVNATTVGMSPTEEQSPVPVHWLREGMVVLDMVYRPLKTRLLKDAEKAGCRCVSGLDMLLFQGVAQFELWTGKVAPVEVMRKALEEATAEEIP
ncbi:MAG: shikimate dehydrogenase [Deltaproteobacteria bacterium]|nr:shikimate dehydrogenase [Deltaproteobacteria bacterium]